MQLAVGLTLFLVFDAIVMFVIFKRFAARRAASGEPADLAGIGNITRFAGTASEETKNYIAANYSGDPGQLPGVLQGLVNRLAERATEQGLTFDRTTLKHFAGTAVIALKAAPQREVTAALESVG